ncbi:MAG: MFS transporter, partial [Hymenobacteraceae bacterium]|nr:MFS transporter [Hymenobacteraceae bacterium]
VPDGPFLSKGAVFKASNMLQAFRDRAFRSAAFGYFGHMWELYTLWAFTPFILATAAPQLSAGQVSIYAFLVIAAGTVGCIGGGYLSQVWGSARVAFIQLLLSGICCLLSVFIFQLDAPFVLVAFLLFWGVVVAGDSPQFSALTAKTAPAHLVGTALTIVVAIGFAITVVSIQLTGHLLQLLPFQFVFALLAVGPALGLLALRRLATS